MKRFDESLRRYLASRGVIAVFVVQVILLLLAFAIPNPGVGAVLTPVLVEVRLLNGVTDLLFAPGYAGLWDPLATLLVLPMVYYVTAVVGAAFWRVVARSGRRLRR